MNKTLKIAIMSTSAVILAGCGLTNQEPKPTETVTITATPSASPQSHTPETSSTAKQPSPATSTAGTTPAQVMESSSTNKSISYKDEPHALIITLPVNHVNEEAYTLVDSETKRAIQLLNGKDISSHIRKVVVKSADGVMLQQTDMPANGSEPAPTESLPNDHAPRADDLIIPQPSLKPVPDAPALSVDVSLLGNEGLRGENYEMYMKVPQSQLKGSPAPSILMKARADSLSKTSAANSIQEIKIYSSDQILLDSMPISQ